MRKAQAKAEANSVAILASGDATNISNVHCLILNQQEGAKMSDQRKENQPRATAGDGQVALELLDRIVKHDKRFQVEGTDRKYWLVLYSQCLRSTAGYPLATVLEEE